MLEGTFFTLLGLSWLTRLVFRQLARLRSCPASLPSCPSICDVVLCCLATTGTLLLNTHHRDLVTSARQVTLYSAFGLSSILQVLSLRCEGLRLPRAGDKLATSIAFLLHLLFSLHFTKKTVGPDQPAFTCSLIAILGCLVSSLISTFSVPAAARYISTVSTLIFTLLAGTWTLHCSLGRTDQSKLVPVLFSFHILTIFTVVIIVLAAVRVQHECLEKIKKNLAFKNIFRKELTKVSQEKLVRDSLNETVETEPINFSFYFKDEISDEIKNVMKTIDEMLINETGKSLEVISEEPELKENKEILLAARENIYANVNIIRNVLDDSKLEESEVM